MEKGPKQSQVQIPPPITCAPNFEAIAQMLPQLVNDIFLLLPPNQYLPMRLLNQNCKKIIEGHLVRRHLCPSQITLFEEQQKEIECLQQNKKAILRTPKLSGAVRADEELINAFAEIDKLPNDCSVFSLYRRHLALNDINLHIIYNKINPSQLFDMFVFNKVIDLSGLYLTRLPSDIFGIFSHPDYFKLPLALCVANNCLSQLPLDLIRLVNLRVLDLSNNKISAIPVNIHVLSELETFLLANNSLSTLPVELIRLPKLSTLDVRRNNLGALPEELAGAKLKRSKHALLPIVLNCSYQQFVDSLPPWLPMSKEQVLATQRHYDLEACELGIQAVSIRRRRT